MQNRGRAEIVDLYSGFPLARESNVANLDSPEARHQFENGKGGVLGIAASGAISLLTEAESYVLFSNVAREVEGGNATVRALCGPNPTARGSLRAASTDPFEPPLVDTNIFGNHVDLQNAVKCVQIQREIFDFIAPLLGMTPAFPPPPFLGQTNEDSVRATGNTWYHLVSGCPLGHVVDDKFAVMGMHRLRVVDSSVMLDMPLYAGTLATTYLLAELAAETIIAEHMP